MKDKKIKFTHLLILAIILRFFLLFTLPHVDVSNHLDWGIRFWQYGPKEFYEQIFWGFSWPNQPIGSVLLFAFIAKLNSAIYQFLWHLNLAFPAFPSFLFPLIDQKLAITLLKLPFALADLGIGLLIYRIVKKLAKKEKPALLASTIFLFNPALIYNSTVWGQTDSLINLFSLLGMWLLWNKKYFLGLFFYALSLYFKLSLIIFVPLFVLIYWKNRKQWPRLLLALTVTISIFLLISLPFVHHGNIFTWIWYLYTNRIVPRQGDMLSGNAFNLWTLFYGVNLSLKENLVLFGSTAKFFGKILFFFVCGLPSLMFILKRRIRKFSALLWLGIIYTFSSFLFLTNMHERYLYPAFPLLAILVGQEKKLLGVFLAASFIYFVNLYNLWWYPRWEIMVSLLTGLNCLLPRLLSLSNIGLFLLILGYAKQDRKKLA